jgi:LmbE family N-acetylglucosaminyl deacetylase
VVLGAILACAFCVGLTRTVRAEDHIITGVAQITDYASQLDISVRSEGKNCRGLLDDSYDTAVTFNAGDTITVSSDTAMRGLYIKWNGAVNPWTLEYNGKTVSCGENGFVHEYIDFGDDVVNCTINIPEKISISDIFAYSAGTLPSDVQVWEKPCENADILAFAAHADDEILFLGGVLATYGGDSVQVAYMCDFWNKEPVREHEKIDGLWEIGIRNYPVCGGFSDIKSLSLERAKEIYSYDEVTAYVTEQIRRFKPLVCVTQDLNGEYGHGAHMLLAHAVCDAVDNSADASFCAESASVYGTYDVPKTYLHLYEQNKIKMNLRTPIERLNGRTALEAASDAYLKHESQQVWDFIVSDDYEHSCAEFGLYRTLVGADTGNDMLENITTYEETARIKAEEESRAEAEKQSSEEASSIAQAKVEQRQETAKKAFPLIAVLVALLTVIIISICIVNAVNKRRRRMRRKYRRK